MKTFKKTSLVAVAAALSLTCNAHAADIRDQMDVQTGKAELVIPDMSPQKVVAQVKDALSQWSIPANASFRPLPSTIPARPNEPVGVQKYYNGAPAISYQCENAYAEITKMPPPVKNAFVYIAEGIQACVFPFQKGVKVYLLHTRVKKTESLTAGLFNGIAKTIQGADDEWMTKQLNENIAAIKKNIPSLLVEKIEVPGAAVQEPDRAAVAALIPAKADLPQAVAVPQVAQASAAVAQTPMQAKIEARKNLTAMGMQYHSQEQFIASIRRKDDVAVQLFLDAGGLDLTAKEKGKTFETIAEEAGAKEIARMIADRIAPSAQKTRLESGAVNAPAAAPAPLSADEKKAILDKVQASISPTAQSEVAKIMASIPADATPDQRETVRAQLLSVHASLRKFTDRIDPETGNLR